MAIRLIDAGTVSHLRSQTIYHGLAHARTESTPDTIVLATPAVPYVCVGFHQDLEWEIDLEFCRERGGTPLFNQTPYLTPEQAQTSFYAEDGRSRLEEFEATRRKFDPGNRMLNDYFYQRLPR